MQVFNGPAADLFYCFHQPRLVLSETGEFQCNEALQFYHTSNPQNYFLKFNSVFITTQKLPLSQSTGNAEEGK